MRTRLRSSKLSVDRPTECGILFRVLFIALFAVAVCVSRETVAQNVFSCLAAPDVRQNFERVRFGTERAGNGESRKSRGVRARSFERKVVGEGEGVEEGKGREGGFHESGGFPLGATLSHALRRSRDRREFQIRNCGTCGGNLIPIARFPRAIVVIKSPSRWRA